MRRHPVLAGSLALLLCALAAGSVLAVHRLTEPAPPPRVSLAVPAVFTVLVGPPPPIPLPVTGSLAIAAVPGGLLGAVRADVMRPIGSVAKTMTALLVVEEHPLAPGAPGPVLTMTAADAALYAQAVAEQGSAVAVRAGEQLTEEQLLQALMLPSANNIAETLARWVGGTRAAFIGLMNRRAAALGMARTHFADPSGFSGATVSTASDLLRLGAAALAVPALAAIVATPSANLPGGTVVRNLDTLLASVPGWVGIKTGWTPQAGGCLLFADRQTIATGAPPVMVVGAVLGQPPEVSPFPAHPELGGAFRAAAAAASAAMSGYGAVDGTGIVPPAQGRVATPWGASAAIASGPGAGGPLVARAGATIRLVARLRPVAAPAPAGSVVGTLAGFFGRRQAFNWPLVLQSALAGPSWQWRLRYG